MTQKNDEDLFFGDSRDLHGYKCIGKFLMTSLAISCKSSIAFFDTARSAVLLLSYGVHVHVVFFDRAKRTKNPPIKPACGSK